MKTDELISKIKKSLLNLGYEERIVDDSVEDSATHPGQWGGIVTINFESGLESPSYDDKMSKWIYTALEETDYYIEPVNAAVAVVYEV